MQTNYRPRSLLARCFLSRCFGALALIAAASGSLSAQEAWPNRPVKLIVPLTAGGGVDMMARLTAQHLSDQLGQQVVVENQGGAGGTIAANAVARARPDGYTLIFQSVSSAVVNALVYKNLPYDPIKDLIPVTLAGSFPLVLVTNPELPAKDLGELIALLKANPGKYSYGSSGVGTLGHLAFELLKLRAGVDIVHIPYKGAAPIVTDLLGNQIQLAVMSVTAAIPQTNAGKLRAIALSSPVQLSAVPDWRPLSDTLPGFDASSRLFLIAPAGTPTAIMRKLNRALEQVLAEPEVLESFAKNGAPAAWSTPEALATEMAEETQRWGSIARSSGAKLE